MKWIITSCFLITFLTCNGQIQEEYEQLKKEQDSVINYYKTLKEQFNALSSTVDSTRHIVQTTHENGQLLKALKQEVDSLQLIMSNQVNKIDSLNTKSRMD